MNTTCQLISSNVTSRLTEMGTNTAFWHMNLAPPLIIKINKSWSSTWETLLLIEFEKRKETLDTVSMCWCSFLKSDLDAVDHATLLNFSQQATMWIKSYLIEMGNRVLWSRGLNPLIPCVLWGSRKVLFSGHFIFFKLYIHDTLLVCKNNHIQMYADNTAILKKNYWRGCPRAFVNGSK